MNSEIFAKRLCELRTESGLSQKQISNQLGMEPANYAKWESGISFPSIESLLRLANLLKASIDYLLGREDIEAPRIQQKSRLYRINAKFICTDAHCEWRHDGYCPGAGCMKETHKENS